MYNGLMATVEANDGAVQQRESLETLERFLRDVSTRLRLIRIIRLACCSVIGSSLFLLSLRCADYVFNFNWLICSFSWAVVVAVYSLPVAGVLLQAFAYKYDSMQLARYVDDRLDLKDRLATALTLRLSIMDARFAGRVVADAERALSTEHPKTVARFKWGILHSTVVTASILTALALLTPASPLSVFSRSYVELVARTKSAGALFLPPNRQPQPASIATLPTPNKMSTGGSKPSTKTEAASTKNAALTAQRTKSSAIAGAINALEHLLGGSTIAKGRSSAGKLADAAPHQKQSHDSSDSQSKVVGHPQSGVTNSIPTLGDKLRQFADKMAKREMTTGEQQDAAKTLDNVNHKLDGLQMNQTQSKLSSAEEDLNGGNQAKAIEDVRSAAYYADHEGAVVPPGQSGNQGTASKNTVSVPIRNAPSAGSRSAAGKPSGCNGAKGSGAPQSPPQQRAASGQGSKSGTGVGSGGSKSTPNKSGGPPNNQQSGKGYGGGTQTPNYGALRKIDPSKLGSVAPPPPVYMPVSSQSGRSTELPGAKGALGSNNPTTVPYVQEQVHFSTSPERAVAAERIPPAYKEVVRRYFSTLPITH